MLERPTSARRRRWSTTGIVWRAPCSLPVSPSQMRPLRRRRWAFISLTCPDAHECSDPRAPGTRSARCSTGAASQLGGGRRVGPPSACTGHGGHRRSGYIPAYSQGQCRQRAGRPVRAALTRAKPVFACHGCGDGGASGTYARARARAAPAARQAGRRQFWFPHRYPHRDRVPIHKRRYRQPGYEARAGRRRSRAPSVFTLVVLAQDWSCGPCGRTSPILPGD